MSALTYLVITSTFLVSSFLCQQKEKYHTHLAVLYLDSVLQMRKDFNTPKSQMDLARSKLRHMLQESTLYRVPLILSKVRETDMHAECAILFGKVSLLERSGKEGRKQSTSE